MPSAVARVEAAATERGWRIEWETAPWATFGWRIRSLRIFDGGGVRASAACTIGRGGSVDGASEQCAAMLLRGAR